MMTMILGVITVVGVLVTRMPDGRAQIPSLPPHLALPPGQSVQAVTYAKDYSLIVTDAQILLVFDSKGHLKHQKDLTQILSPN